MNNRTGAIRCGFWRYYWPGDFFIVKIKGLGSARAYSDDPSTGGWAFLGDF